MSKPKVTSKLILAVFASSIGSSFQFGYNTAVVNAPRSFISQFINETHFERTGEYMEAPRIYMIWSWIVSSFRYSALVGALLTAVVADKLGRKRGLLWNNFLIILAVCLEGISKPCGSYELLLVGRLFIGLCSGLSIGLVILYLTEISPLHLRGALGTLYPLVVGLSVIVSQILGLERFLGTESRWTWLFSFSVIPAILQICTLPFCPESPSYAFFNKGNEAEARRGLVWFRGTSQIQEELDDMQLELEHVNATPGALKQIFFNPAFRRPLIISCTVMLAQQLCGINAVMFFSTKFFTSAGLNKTTARVATFGMGIFNILMTIASLILVEKVGRKRLMLVGLSAMLIDLVALSFCIQYVNDLWISYICVSLVVLFIALFALGPGSIPWFFVAELFTQRFRAIAVSIVVSVNMIASFLVGLSFLPLLVAFGLSVFTVFAVLLVPFVAFTFFKVPETRGKTVMQIAAMFGASNET